MAKYKLKEDGVINTETNANVPEDERNNDWQDYLEWVAEGNTPDAADPHPWELPPTKEERLSDTDKNMARVGEDLLDILIAKGIISLDDFTQEAKDKLAERVNIRKMTE